MSDYLSHVLARSRSLTEGIQPRLTSLFEPSSAVSSMIAEPLPAVERLDEATMDDQTASDALPPTRPLVRPPVRRPQEPQMPVSDVRGRLDVPQQRVDNATTMPRLPAAVEPALTEAPAQARLERPEQPQTAARSVSSTPPPQGAVAPSPLPVLAPLRRRTVVEPRLASVEPQPFARVPSTPTPVQATRLTLAAGEASVPPGPVTTPVVRPEVAPALPVHVARPAAPTPGIVQPQVTPQVQPEVPPLASAASQTAPTIRVTIGRLEVRAMMPPAPPAPHPKPARPGPKLSLNDYLKQRSGGQR